jgi:hypothetical protein
LEETREGAPPGERQRALLPGGMESAPPQGGSPPPVRKESACGVDDGAAPERNMVVIAGDGTAQQ